MSIVNERCEMEPDESSAPFDDAVVTLLETRHREYLDDPSKVVTWEDMKVKIGKIPDHGCRSSR